MSNFEPIAFFPNFIFIPKIVPLVYDDTLSYYEFYCKVLNKLNECIDSLNDLGIDVAELKTAVERLGTLIDGFDGRIEDLETAVGTINGTIDGINTALNNINGDIASLQAKDLQLTNDLAALANTVNTEIAAAVSALQTQIGSVASDVTAMDSQVTALDGRVTALEAATINVPTMSNENKIICQDFMNLDNLDYEIVMVTDNSAANNNIVVNDGLIRFMSSSSLNEMALVIHNVLPYYNGNPYNNQIVSFGNRYKTSGSSNGVDYCINVPFSSLTGSTPYIANTNYTATRASLRIVQLKRSSTDNNFYDLWIYNRYHGEYPILTGANVDYLNLVMVFRSLDTTSMSVDAIKAYFISELNSNGRQIASLVDRKNSEIYDYIDRQDLATRNLCQTNIEAAEDRTALKALPFRNNNDTWFELNGQASNFIVSDSSFKTQTAYAQDYYNGTLTGIDTAVAYFSGEVEILDSTGVNLGAGWLDLGVVNIERTEGSDYLIPEEEIEILAMPRLNINYLPCRCEMILTKARHLRLRVEFDDTNFDWDNNTLIVKYSGVAALHWVDSYYPPV